MAARAAPPLSSPRRQNSQVGIGTLATNSPTAVHGVIHHQTTSSTQQSPVVNMLGHKFKSKDWVQLRNGISSQRRSHLALASTTPCPHACTHPTPAQHAQATQAGALTRDKACTAQQYNRRMRSVRTQTVLKLGLHIKTREKYSSLQNQEANYFKLQGQHDHGSCPAQQSTGPWWCWGTTHKGASGAWAACIPCHARLQAHAAKHTPHACTKPY